MNLEVRRILLVRLGAVGDVIRALPLLHALRAALPKAHIAWAVEEPSADLLRSLEALDAVHVLPRRRLARQLVRPWQWPDASRSLLSFVRSCRAGRFDLVLDIHGTFKAALVARLAGGKRVVGFGPGGSKEGASLLYSRSHPFPALPMSRVRRALMLGCMEGLIDGDPAELERSAEFGLSFDEPRAQRIAEFAVAGARPLVVIFPFASIAGQSKRWPLERHAELARRLAKGGARIVMAWGSAAEEAELRALAPGLELAPRTDLVELRELLRHADLLVTGDTGPMHLAAAVNTRVLALFGPSNPVINRPWGEDHVVLVHEPLSALGVDEVEEAARLLL